MGVEGVGKVGSELIALLDADGARVIATDVNRDALDAVVTRFPSVVVTDDLLRAPLDIYSPCALGGTLRSDTVSDLTASIVCGAANNQLLTSDIDEVLHERGVIWIPDYVANAGGLIQVYGERAGAGAAWVRDRVEGIYDTVLAILDQSQSRAIPPGRAADETALARVAAAHA
ncbi:hypothetical protein [Nocardia farcinica]|uniref:hypothetical protein n=1 Tax=Nocardia farcinica TaxID=37329 RepID=UPI001894A49F|nr:hypothetical protein [Nocardia farcinica]MBF6271686.1 hypothetical protein [Nocardia farcinica]